MPETLKIEIKVFKPRLKLKLGDLVIQKNNKKGKIMVISGFLPLDGKKADYVCKRVSSQGKPKNEFFLENELKIVKHERS